MEIIKNHKNSRIVFSVDDRVVKDFWFGGIYRGWALHSLLSSGILPNKHSRQVHAAFTVRAWLWIRLRVTGIFCKVNTIAVSRRCKHTYQNVITWFVSEFLHSNELQVLELQNSIKPFLDELTSSAVEDVNNLFSFYLDDYFSVHRN